MLGTLLHSATPYNSVLRHPLLWSTCGIYSAIESKMTSGGFIVYGRELAAVWRFGSKAAPSIDNIIAIAGSRLV
jgi:hypothetical protein